MPSWPVSWSPWKTIRNVTQSALEKSSDTWWPNASYVYVAIKQPNVQEQQPLCGPTGWQRRSPPHNEGGGLGTCKGCAIPGVPVEPNMCVSVYGPVPGNPIICQLLLDATNGFSELNQKAMMWTVWKQWPAGDLVCIQLQPALCTADPLVGLMELLCNPLKRGCTYNMSLSAPIMPSH